ncbi:MAG: hypothetical protein ACPGSM_12115 [Thiolinea sp.]
MASVTQYRAKTGKNYSYMHHTLDQFTDNPIIDEIVCWPPREKAISSIRASVPMFRKPFIEVTLKDGETSVIPFAKQNFGEYWSEAQVILETLTGIELIAEFQQARRSDHDELVAQVLAERDESIEEVGLMFEHGMYQQYLSQFGKDYKGLPDEVMERIAVAKSKVEA